MKLNELLKQIEVSEIRGDETIDITNLNTDSRRVSKKGLFVAQKGVQVDGHNYINNAIDLGAKAVVYEVAPQEYVEGVTYIRVKDSMDAIARLASCWYGNPSEKVTLVGVTGTNGKTTTATLLYKMFLCFGYKTGLLSTVANYVNDKIVPATHTTPDPLSLNRLLKEMVDAGCEYVFMEVSSHAIHQKRTAGLVFDGAIFTNLTQDHLDYHETMAEYLAVKKSFFDNLSKTAFALTNIDDKNGEVMLQNTKAQKHTYSVKNLADFKGKILEKRFDSTTIEINNTELEVQFVGTFNVYNLLAVYGACILLGKQAGETLLALSTMLPVSGRFETLHSRNGYTAIVDYAHTPDAVRNVLEAIHDVLNGSGKLITVVGCGGNRDKTKRPLMAQEAFLRSDQLILTSDNPRFEEPMAIIDDMSSGLNRAQLNKTLLIEDRKQAIKTACTLAKSGDVILVAGKGHEDYQDIKGVKYHFSDRESLLEIFNA